MRTPRPVVFTAAFLAALAMSAPTANATPTALGSAAAAPAVHNPAAIQPGATTTVKKRRPKIVSASATHSPGQWVFRVKVKPASKKLRDQIRKVDYVLGVGTNSTVTSVGLFRSRNTTTMDFPIEWDSSEWPQVCNGRIDTTLSVTVTTVAGRRSKVHRTPVSATTTDADTHGGMDCLPYTGGWTEFPGPVLEPLSIG